MPYGSAEKSNNEAGRKAGAAAEAEARRLQELASDPAHGGKITPGSMEEAKAALGLEEAGRLPGPLTRDPTGAADFLDGRGVAWDVKSFNSNFPPSQGGYELATSMLKIGAELLLGEHVILNTTNLSAEATAELQAAVDAAGYGDRVLFWP